MIVRCTITEPYMPNMQMPLYINLICKGNKKPCNGQFPLPASDSVHINDWQLVSSVWNRLIATLMVLLWDIHENGMSGIRILKPPPFSCDTRQKIQRNILATFDTSAQKDPKLVILEQKKLFFLTLSFTGAYRGFLEWCAFYTSICHDTGFWYFV